MMQMNPPLALRLSMIYDHLKFTDFFALDNENYWFTKKWFKMFYLFSRLVEG